MLKAMANYKLQPSHAEICHTPAFTEWGKEYSKEEMRAAIEALGERESQEKHEFRTWTRELKRTIPLKLIRRTVAIKFKARILSDHGLHPSTMAVYQRKTTLVNIDPSRPFLPHGEWEEIYIVHEEEDGQGWTGMRISCECGRK